MRRSLRCDDAVDVDAVADEDECELLDACCCDAIDVDDEDAGCSWCSRCGSAAGLA